MAERISFSATINGQAVGPLDIPADLMLTELLHEYLNLTGTRAACGQGVAAEQLQGVVGGQPRWVQAEQACHLGAVRHGVGGGQRRGRQPRVERWAEVGETVVPGQAGVDGGQGG